MSDTTTTALIVGLTALDVLGFLVWAHNAWTNRRSGVRAEDSNGADIGEGRRATSPRTSEWVNSYVSKGRQEIWAGILHKSLRNVPLTEIEKAYVCSLSDWDETLDNWSD